MLTTAITWGRDCMAEISEKVQHSRHEGRQDARQLWLPITAVIVIIMAVVGGAVGIGMWLQRTNDRAETTITLTAQLQAVDNKLATLQGSINTLTGMQSELAKTSANVGAMQSQMDGFEVRLQTMDTWIQDTQRRLAGRGIETKDYTPGVR